MLYKNKKAFTLVELLIVIAIIGILSTAAVINLRAAKEKAQKANILANLIQVQKTALLCVYSNNELGCDNGGDCNPSDGNNDYTTEYYPWTTGQVVCHGGGANDLTWPMFSDVNWSWVRAQSNANNGTFCFILKDNDNSNQYISCSNNGCHESAVEDCLMAVCATPGNQCSLGIPCCTGDPCPAQGHICPTGGGGI
jgi:prepilin-type N-terminal cleavage/methylation domain-containing protein